MTAIEDEVWSGEQTTGLDLSGVPFEEHYRIHHTWWRTTSGWKIIEGMGADVTGSRDAT
jgi:hypothetical protein